MTAPIPIVALDVPNRRLAIDLVDALGAQCDFYKVGSELFTAVGPEVVTALRDEGKQVFLDLKLHDIPNTVAGAVRSAAALGARLVTVHAAGGETMLRSAVAAAGSSASCGILAVTVLTSLDAAAIADAWDRRDALRVENEVLRLAEVAQRAGCHGIVCSGQEAAAVTARFGESLAVLVPGVRMAGGDAQDQSRVVTPEGAASAGARYVVVGRAVTGASDRTAAMRAVKESLAAGMSRRPQPIA